MKHHIWQNNHPMPTLESGMVIQFGPRKDDYAYVIVRVDNSLIVCRLGSSQMLAESVNSIKQIENKVMFIETSWVRDISYLWKNVDDYYKDKYETAT